MRDGDGDGLCANETRGHRGSGRLAVWTALPGRPQDMGEGPMHNNSLGDSHPYIKEPASHLSELGQGLELGQSAAWDIPMHPGKGRAMVQLLLVTQVTLPLDLENLAKRLNIPHHQVRLQSR